MQTATKNKYVFFILRILRDIFNPTVWGIPKIDFHNKKLGKYYLDFSEIAVEKQKGVIKTTVFDANGIPMTLTYIDVVEKKAVYFPITIGQMGLAVFHTYLDTKSEEDKNRFLEFPKWFYKNAVEDEKLGVRWLTHVPLPQYQQEEPWQSAFVQGRGISNLLRGWQLTGNEEWRIMAEKALIPFTIPVEEGGVTVFTQWGPFYEEYTSKAPTLVLNGMIFSLFGVFDFVRVFPENELGKKIMTEGLETIKNILPEFDMSFWTKYNLCKADWYPPIDPATIGYQHLHVNQLTVLYQFTKEKTFLNYATKFKKQINIINILRMYFVKYKALKKLGRL